MLIAFDLRAKVRREFRWTFRAFNFFPAQGVRVSYALFLIISCCLIAGAGCNSEYTVEVDLSAPEPRFIFDGRTWGWPFRWPRVNALAIGADEESMWEIESVDPKGVPARQFAIVYGELPEGFVQTHPKQNLHPKRLTQKRNYFVGAGGPNNEIFRTVFALPVHAAGPVADPNFEPERQRMTFPQQLPPPPPKPAE
jgi:hypothetical protein